MNDHFALLHQPRRPWLDPQEVQASFRALSGLVHPDRVHNAPEEERAVATDQFASLNAACQCLLEPRRRLRHLLELERGGAVKQLEQLPSAGMDFYFQLGQACRSVDDFLASKPAGNSPLLQVRFFQGALHWREQLEDFQRALETRRADLENQLRSMNPAWAAAPDVGNTQRAVSLPLEQLEEIYRQLSYVIRWSEQIRARLLELAI